MKPVKNVSMKKLWICSSKTEACGICMEGAGEPHEHKHESYSFWCSKLHIDCKCKEV
jgi:hypothetical protein